MNEESQQAAGGPSWFNRRGMLRLALLGGAVSTALGDKVFAGSSGKSSKTDASGPQVRSIPFTSLEPQASIGPVPDVYAACALNLSRMAALATRCKLDVPYGDDPAQKLDIYLPQQQDATGLPVFINIHGGGWVFGYKEWMGLNAPAIVSFPAVYVSIGYRLAPAHKHPAQMEDCFQALSWVHENIRAYGGNPDRITVGGHSAGAHLASLLALRTDVYSRFKLPPKPVLGCFAYNGIYDLRDVTDYGEVASNNPGAPLLGDAAAAADSSPLAFVGPDHVPFFITWAENDNTLIKAQSAAFVAALKGHGNRVEKHMFPRFDHFYSHLDQQRPDSLWTRTLRAWMTGDPDHASFAA